MKDERISDALLRQFLLGTTHDEERQRIESLFLTDADLRERVLGVEQDLIEDYLENSLTAADKERFLKLYAQTPEQQQKLRITKSIKDWAVSEAVSPETVSSPALPSSKKRGWLRPTVAVPIALAVVIAIVFAIVWLNRRNEAQKHLAIEQELAQLNSPESLRQVPQQMILKELRPVAVRSVEPAVQLDSSSEVRLIELRLPWIHKERYSTYQARVLSLADNNSFTIPNLQAPSDGEYVIRLRLPVQILLRGNYRLELSGITADGTTGITEEYGFVVGS
jgi:anti-sigma-K factor RskA